MATITYIEAAGLTNDAIRAAAGAHPLCCGYPDGVPETWRDVARVKRGNFEMSERPGKHFICETRGGAGGGALDPAALLGPIAEPVDWPEPDAAGDEE